VTGLILHDAERLGGAVTHRWSIQKVDGRGDPTGVVCLFDVPPADDVEEERRAARAIFNAVNAHSDLLSALKLIADSGVLRGGLANAVWSAIHKAEGRS
jgi:hypothetical protein